MADAFDAAMGQPSDTEAAVTLPADATDDEVENLEEAEVVDVLVPAPPHPPVLLLLHLILHCHKLRRVRCVQLKLVPPTGLPIISAKLLRPHRRSFGA